MKPYLCIYHGNCADGFTAAWVLRNALGESNVDFVPGFYGKSPPSKQILASYEVVYMVDFSYKRPVLLTVAEDCKKIIIIDHHKTAQEDLVDLPANVETVFDMNHSGAMLTWMYFVSQGALSVYIPGHNPDSSPLQPMPEDLYKYAPPIIQRVEDRDLWRFKFSDTRAVQANMFSYEYTFENWDYIASQELEKFAQAGEAIERKHFKDIKEMIAVTKCIGKIREYTIPIANLPYIYSSDAGHIMGVEEHFAACYWFTPDGIVFSLRSADDGVDVSEIAKSFGGGGHKHAAGFQLSIEELTRYQLSSDINLNTQAKL